MKSCSRLAGWRLVADENLRVSAGIPFACTYYVVEGKCTRVYLCYLAQGQHRRIACELERDHSPPDDDDDDSRPAATAAVKVARVRGLFIYLTRQNSSKPLRVFSVEDTHRTKTDVFSFWYIRGMNLSLSYLLEYMGIGAHELSDSIHRWNIGNSQSEKYKYESRVYFHRYKRLECWTSLLTALFNELYAISFFFTAIIAPPTVYLPETTKYRNELKHTTEFYTYMYRKNVLKVDGRDPEGTL
uniref:Anoctamin n=1 Tax=Trichogramma kaykai TaxID=54128 RepID=A0ABD2WWU0_9HYME